MRLLSCGIEAAQVLVQERQLAIAMDDLTRLARPGRGDRGPKDLMVGDQPPPGLLDDSRIDGPMEPAEKLFQVDSGLGFRRRVEEDPSCTGDSR